MTAPLATGAIGAALDRDDGVEKVTGRARYAVEHPVARVAHGWLVQSTVARGSVAGVDAAEALAAPGVLAVLTHEDAPRVGDVSDGELRVLQSPAVAYRGQVVAMVVAESLEEARDAAARVRVRYDAEPHDVELRSGHPRLYRPDKVNPAFPADTDEGDFDDSFAAADVRVDAVYETPAYHNNPMETHASLALWDAAGLTVYESTQAPWNAAATLADVFEVPREQVRVIAQHVGGGFGAKGTPRPNAVLAAMAARVVERPVKLAVTRREMFSLVGYRTPTIQRVRLGAGRDGRLAAIAHEVEEQSSTVREFAEQTAVVTRTMYAAPHRRTAHRLARLDVPSPSWMRAPGECPGMFALESAMDELAYACGIDPVELRARNEPETDPESGEPFTSRNLVACLREGAARFDWPDRPREPRARHDGRRLVGTGVASAVYPVYRQVSAAFARAEGDGRFVVGVAAVDIGTGARTALRQIAADALGVDPGAVRVELGDSALPRASVAGGSSGTASWGTAVHKACTQLRERGLEGSVSVDTRDDVRDTPPGARFAFGAHFVEAHVDVDTGEVRVPRMLGVFAAGRIVNPKTARSQFLGGMTMGLSMALHEESVLDREFGDYLNHDFAQYHVATCADVRDMDATWIEEDDDKLNPMGTKGIGEIGIVGSAAAVANAVFHATGIRVRRLPIQPDKLVR